MHAATYRAPAGVATTALVVAGAVSAGVHAGLAPDHLHEWAPLGSAFIAAAAAGAVLVAALAARPTSPWPRRLLGALLGSLIVTYALTRLVALPPLDPTREPLDTLGVCTSAVETAGLVIALRLGRLDRPGRDSLALTTGGTA